MKRSFWLKTVWVYSLIKRSVAALAPWASSLWKKLSTYAQTKTNASKRLRCAILVLFGLCAGLLPSSVCAQACQGGRVADPFASPRRNTAKKYKVVMMEVEATAYCPCKKCCGKNAKGITASGHKISPADNLKIIAVDKKAIPLGSRVYVEGIGWTRALDTGSAIKGKKIDVLFCGKNAHQKALQFGRKRLKIWIVRWAYK